MRDLPLPPCSSQGLDARREERKARSLTLSFYEKPYFVKVRVKAWVKVRVMMVAGVSVFLFFLPYHTIMYLVKLVLL